MSARNSLRGWLGLALGLHAAGLAWVGAHRSAPIPDAPEVPMQLAEIEAPEALPLPAGDSVTPPSADALPQAVTRAAVPPAGAARAEVVETPPTVASSEPPTAGTSDTWSFNPSAGAAPSSSAFAGLGLGGALSAGVRATVAESLQRDQAEAAKVKPHVFTARDLELGLVPGGNLVGLTRERVRIGLTPSSGHAVLEFHLDGSGVLASVSVVDASSDRAEWDEMATRLVRDARSSPPSRMPSGVRGATVTLSVDSSERTVSGSSTGGGFVSKALRAVNDPVDTLIDSKAPVQRVVAVRIVDVHTY